MNDNFDDQLSRQLASLNADLAGAKLPGATAARQRAAQRTRHQLTGGVVAGVAVVAIGAIGIIQPDFRADHTPQPADTPTVNPTTEPVAVPPEALLTDDEVTGDTGVDWQAVDDPGRSYACVPEFPAGVTQMHLVTDSQAAQFSQFVEVSDNAADRFAQLRTGIESCVDGLSQQGDYGLDQVWKINGLGDEAWMAAYWAPLLEPDEYAGAAIVQVRIVRSGQYVTVVVDGGAAQDFNGSMEPLRAVQATTRLCETVDTTCPGTLDFERLYPQAIGDLAGWLSADQVSLTTGLAQITEGSEPRSADGWNYVGLPIDPNDARSVDSRDYFDPTNPTDIAITQTVARFDDADAARTHFDELVAAADAFTQDGDVIEKTGTVNGDGYDGVIWRSENAEFGTGFFYGVVTSGDAVSVIMHSVSAAGSTNEVTAEQVTQLLTAAGEQLGES